METLSTNAHFGNHEFSVAPEVWFGKFFRLHWDAVKEVRAASQVLAGFLAFKDGEMYADMSEFLKALHVPIGSGKRYVADLMKAGYIQNHGRLGRRTSTFTCTQKARDLTGYARLPVVAAEILPRWSEKIVLAEIVSKHGAAKAVSAEHDYIEVTPTFKIRTLSERCGLSMSQTRAALDSLEKKQLIRREHNIEKFAVLLVETISPNLRLKVVSFDTRPQKGLRF